MSDGTPAGKRLVPCPACGAPSEFAPTNQFRPFCSERCKAGDLGAWAMERYRVADPATPSDPIDPPH
ncbi:MAG TPA: DNA gyrase inhibitor YacG [Methylibium sp.]|nr:DNA gyrase inhibitor YacG [Methylibium sp.]